MGRGLPPYPLEYDVRFNLPLHCMRSLFFGKKLMNLYNAQDVHIFGKMSVACRLDIFLEELLKYLFHGRRPGKTIPVLQALRDARTEAQISESFGSSLSSSVPRPQPVAWSSTPTFPAPVQGRPITVQEVTKDGVKVNLSSDAAARMRVHVSKEPSGPGGVCPYCRSCFCGASSKRVRGPPRGPPRACKNTTTVVHVQKMQKMRLNKNRTGWEKSKNCSSCNYSSSSRQQDDDTTKNNYARFTGEEEGEVDSDIEMQSVSSSEFNTDLNNRESLSSASQDSPVWRRPSVEKPQKGSDPQLQPERRTGMGDCSSSGKSSQEGAAGRRWDNYGAAASVGDSSLDSDGASSESPLDRVGRLDASRHGKATAAAAAAAAGNSEWTDNVPKLMYSIMSCDTDDTVSSSIMQAAAYLQSKLLMSSESLGWEQGGSGGGETSSRGRPTPSSSKTSSFRGYPLQAVPDRCRSLVLLSSSIISLASLRSLA